MKKKAPKVKKKVPSYAEGTPLVAEETPIDYQYKPQSKKGGDGNFSDKAKDAGRLLARGTLGLVGAQDTVNATYNTDMAQKADATNMKYILPAERAGIGAALNFAAPGLGTAYNTGTSAISKGIDANKNARLPNETDQEYAQRMSAQGVDIYANQGLQGHEGQIANGVGGIMSAFKDGGTVSPEKAKLILKEGTIRGKTISDKQRKYFGFIAGGGKPGMADGGILGDTTFTGKPDWTVDGFSGTTKTVNEQPERKQNMVTYFPALKKDGTVGTFQGSIKTLPSQFLKDSLYSKDSNTFPLNPNQGTELSPEDAQKAYKNNPNLFWNGTFPGGIKTEKGKPFEYGRADGGEIEGKGGAKDDAIKAKIEPGSFVVPAENAHLAEQLREKYFGNDKKAKLNQSGGRNVNLSNGEHLFTPEEKAFLLKKGVDLKQLAPNAKEESNDGDIKKKFMDRVEEIGFGDAMKEHQAKYANGTTESGIPSVNQNKNDKFSDLYADQLTEEQNKKAQDIIKNQGNPNAPKPSQQDIDLANQYISENNNANLNTNSSANKGVVVPADSKSSSAKKSSSVTPENALALGQILYGGSKLIKSKRPVDTLDASFNNAVNQAMGEAGYGFNPAEKQSALSDLETARLSNVGLAANYAGGDPQKAMANARVATNMYGKNLVDLAAQDAEAKLQKERYATGLEAQRANFKRTLFNDKMDAFNQNQQAGAALLSSGIENYFGSRRYDKEAQALKENPNNFDSNALLKWMDSHNLKTQ